MNDSDFIDEGLRARRMKKARSELAVAIEKSDMALLARALVDGANPFEQDKSGWCQWMLAVKKGRLQALDALAKHGEKTLGREALALLRDGCGRTLLHHAVESRDDRVLDWALSLGVDLDAQSDDGTSALMLASLYGVGSGGKCPVEKLLKAGANAALRDCWGSTALMDACRRGHVDAARALLSRGLDACLSKAMCSVGRSASYLAIQSQAWDLVKLMLDKGAMKPESWVWEEHVKGEGPKRGNALMAAAERRAAHCMDLLATPKAAMAVGEGGKDALMFLAESGQWNRVQEMARVIAPLSDVNRKDGRGRTAEQIARKNKMDEFADYLAALRLSGMESKVLKETVAGVDSIHGGPARARL